MFSKKNKKPNERVLHECRPNMIIGCKKAIYGAIVLWIIMYISGPIKSAIINLQTYYISYLKFGVIGYISLAIVLLMIIVLIYIIWQLLSWYSTLYTITNERIIAKKGVFNTKTYYMPYKSIQDIDLSQNLIEKLINVGTITAYSAYDNNNIKLAYITNPGEVEDLLFEKMNNMYMPAQDNNYSNDYNHKRHSKRKPRYYDNQEYEDYDSFDYNHERYSKRKPRYYDNQEYGDYDSFDYNHERYSKRKPRYYDNQEYEDYDYRDQYEDKITYDDYPKEEYRKKHSYKQYDYEEYPNFNEKKNRKYEYEYYDDNLEDNINSAMRGMENKYYNQNNEYEEDEPYYNDYDYDSMEEFYNENKQDFNIPQEPKRTKKSKKHKSDVFQRHFEKFR